MFYFIINPSSKTKSSRAIWQHVNQVLHQRGIPHHVCATRYPGHASELARSVSRSDPNADIIVLGGDGTIHEVLNGLENLDTVTLGVIPTGSANDFCSGMGIPSDPSRALAAILHPVRKTSLDIGRITSASRTSRFAVSAGIGFDAAVCHEAISSPVKSTLNALHAGPLTYSVIAARQIALYVPGASEIRLDGDRHFRFPDTYFIAVMNQRFEGGGLMMAPNARPDDGVLDVFVCSGISRSRLIASLPAVKYGRHAGLKGAHFLKCRRIEILMDRRRPVHADGESGGVSRTLTADFEPAKLSVITG